MMAGCESLHERLYIGKYGGEEGDHFMNESIEKEPFRFIKKEGGTVIFVLALLPFFCKVVFHIFWIFV